MMPNLKKNRKKVPGRTGFSLVEIMIVLVLVGMLAAMVGPPMYGYLQAQRLQTGADRFVTDLQYARAQAISRGRVMRVVTTVNSYQVSDLTSGAVLRQQNLDQGVVLAIAQQADFYPWGMADNSIFNISNTTGARQVSLLPTGIVEVQ